MLRRIPEVLPTLVCASFGLQGPQIEIANGFANELSETGRTERNGAAAMAIQMVALAVRDTTRRDCLMWAWSGLNPLGVHSPCGFESRPGHAGSRLREFFGAAAYGELQPRHTGGG